VRGWALRGEGRNGGRRVGGSWRAERGEGGRKGELPGALVGKESRRGGKRDQDLTGGEV